MRTAGRLSKVLGTIPIGTRLKAWWEGYDAAEYHAWVTGRRDTEPTKIKAAVKAQVKAVNEIAWDADRIEIANLVWGEGYCGPGGPQHVVDLAKLLGLSPEMSVLIVGGGLGGPARALAKNYGCYMSAYEASKELAAAGTKLSADAGLAKKAPIEHYNPEKIKPFPRKFDAAVAKESFFTINNKEAVLKAVHASLKNSSLFLITDYVLSDEVPPESETVQEWMKEEPIEPFMVTNAQMVALFESVNFNLRVKDDISEHYRDLIAQSWKDSTAIVQKLVAQGEDNKSLIETLLREATIWARRSALLEKGTVRVMRYLAEKAWFD